MTVTPYLYWNLILLFLLLLTDGNAATTKSIPNPFQTCEKLQSLDSQYRCYKAYANWKNPDNHPNIPAACNDTSGKFQAVRYGFAPVHTNSKPLIHWEDVYGKPRTYFYIPVREVADRSLNGHIAYDFNRDQLLDYVFAESVKKTKEPDMRLAVCMSSERGYQRQRIELSIAPSYYDGLNQVLHTFSLDKGLLSVKYAAIFYEFGYKLNQNWFGWDTSRQTLILKKIHRAEFPDGSGLGSEETSSSKDTKVYDLRTKQYQKNLVCNDLAPASDKTCKFVEHGKFSWEEQIPALGASDLGEPDIFDIPIINPSEIGNYRKTFPFYLIEVPSKTSVRKTK